MPDLIISGMTVEEAIITAKHQEEALIWSIIAPSTDNEQEAVYDKDSVETQNATIKNLIQDVVRL